jgi:hypothetical protein
MQTLRPRSYSPVRFRQQLPTGASAFVAVTSISSPQFRDSPTGVDAESPVTRGRLQEMKTQAAWQRVIDQTLMDWLRDPGQLQDEGVVPPAGTIIRLSMDMAESFRDEGRPAPDSVVVDPNGGIVFERREGNVSEVLHVWEDRTVEYMRFEGARLVERGPA